jgi:hypothetical protein
LHSTSNASFSHVHVHIHRPVTAFPQQVFAKSGEGVGLADAVSGSGVAVRGLLSPQPTKKPSEYDFRAQKGFTLKGKDKSSKINPKDPKTW